jgi:hypothetical protein
MTSQATFSTEFPLLKMMQSCVKPTFRLCKGFRHPLPAPAADEGARAFAALNRPVQTESDLFCDICVNCDVSST